MSYAELRVDAFEKFKQQYKRAVLTSGALALLSLPLILLLPSLRRLPVVASLAFLCIFFAFTCILMARKAFDPRTTKIQFALGLGDHHYLPLLGLIRVSFNQNALLPCFIFQIVHAMIYGWAAHRLRKLDPDAPKPYVNEDLQEYIRTHGYPDA